jgi:hypothetical protein
MTQAGSRRFRDPLTRLWNYSDEILVRCPACQGRAVVLAAPDTAGEAPATRLRRRLSCLGCAHGDTWTAPRRGNAWLLPDLSGPDDPYFGRPLWLQATCCGGHVLWAYNAAHLDLVEAYLAARLRERGSYIGSMSLVERLPRWMTLAKNRAEVLRTLRSMRASLTT